MIWWCISPVIQAFFEAYQSTVMSFTCILYFFCKQWGVFDLPMTDSFLWLEPSMLVIISSVSLSLHFAEPTGLHHQSNRSCETKTYKTGQFHPHCKCHLRALRRELASLLFSTQVKYLSASFFLYLLFAERMILWSSSCIIEVALGGSIRNLMWEYSQTWWLEALSQTYSMWWFESLISLLSLVMIWWCISPVIQAFFEAYQSTVMSFTCILYFFCK